MDFPSAWKASSIVLTGAFGVLGLLKDFKDKQTHKVTRWGYLSLAGILISTAFGVVAQLKETSDNAAKAFELAKKSDATLQKEDIALQQLQRTLSPSVSTSRIYVVLSPPCQDDQFKHFCAEVEKVSWGLLNLPNFQAPYLRMWPPTSEKFNVAFDLYIAGNLKPGPYYDQSDLVYHFALDRNNDAHAETSFIYSRSSVGSDYRAEFPPQTPKDADGKIVVLSDLSGSTATIRITEPDAWNKSPTLPNMIRLGFISPGARDFSCNLKPISGVERNPSDPSLTQSQVYRCTFPVIF